MADTKTDRPSAKPPSLYVLQFESSERQTEIFEELGHADWVSEVIKSFPTKGAGRLYAAVIVDQQSEPTHICRLLRRGNVGLDRMSVGLSDIEEVNSQDSTILKSSLTAATSKRRKKEVLSQLNGLSVEENRDFLISIEAASISLADRVREKGRADDRMLRGYSDHAKEIVGFERDSLGVALEIAFGRREALLVDGISKTLPGSFLEMLGQDRFIEDEIIAFDKARFPGMEGLVTENPRVKIFKHNDATLEIIHANRNDLEHTLGVDLIYVSHYFNSFIGLQYKMLEGQRPSAQYSPDAKFRSQLNKMELMVKSLPAAIKQAGQRDYRLHAGPFFFKFVSRLETNFSDDALCPGLYIPADLVGRIVRTSPATIGESRGTRHLSNTEFAELFRQGWIGTTSNDTATLQRMIGDAVSGKRSLTIAIDRRTVPKERGRRMQKLLRMK